MTTIAKESGTFESYDGTAIYYELRGQGEPIVFVYGIACLMNHWHHQVSAFSKSYQTITFDIRGHHKSAQPKDSNNVTVAGAAKDLLSLMQHLKLSRAHFVGHSFGVPLLLSAYEQRPEMFSSLCFVNGFASNPIKGMFGLDFAEPLFHFIKNQYAANPTLWDSIWKGAINNPVSMWLSGLAGGFNLRLTQFKDIEIYARGVSQIPLQVFLPLFEDMMAFNGQSIAEKISCPCLIIAGDKDFVTPLPFQQHLHESIRGSEYFVVPYGSHCTQLDFPDYFNLRLERFLREHAQR